MTGEGPGDGVTRVFSYVCCVGGDGTGSQTDHRTLVKSGVESATSWISLISCFGARTGVNGSQTHVTSPHNSTLDIGLELTISSGVRVCDSSPSVSKHVVTSSNRT